MIVGWLAVEADFDAVVRKSGELKRLMLMLLSGRVASFRG